MNIQTFLTNAIPNATADLEKALLGLPADKRNWSAGGQARSALDMVAEVAILNGVVADVVQSRAPMPDFDFAAYTREKAELAQNWDAVKLLLDANTARVVEAIGAVPDDDLSHEVTMPWGAMTLTQIIEYPYWNAKYHEGQINFIASMLDCLK